MNNQNAYLKKLTLTAIFIALGVLLAPLVSFPFGGARVFPLQHLINVLLAVLLGWRYSVAGAFCTCGNVLFSAAPFGHDLVVRA